MKKIDLINVQSQSQFEMIDITNEIQNIVKNSKIEDGICIIYTPHTTAAITINEGADPSVKRDILYEISKIVPINDNYHHMEGNSAAHIKSSMFGVSETIIIDDFNLVLGTWQSIYFCEFDGPRSRKVYVKIIK